MTFCMFFFVPSHVGLRSCHPASKIALFRFAFCHFRHLWPRVTIVSYFMLRMLANSIGKDDWKAVSTHAKVIILNTQVDTRALGSPCSVQHEISGVSVFKYRFPQFSSNMYSYSRAVIICLHVSTRRGHKSRTGTRYARRLRCADNI